jgi:hypothetical protein
MDYNYGFNRNYQPQTNSAGKLPSGNDASVSVLLLTQFFRKNPGPFRSREEFQQAIQQTHNPQFHKLEELLLGQNNFEVLLFYAQTTSGSKSAGIDLKLLLKVTGGDHHRRNLSQADIDVIRDQYGPPGNSNKTPSPQDASEVSEDEQSTNTENPPINLTADQQSFLLQRGIHII